MKVEQDRFDLTAEEHEVFAVVLRERIFDPADFYFAAKSAANFDAFAQDAVETAFTGHHSEEGRRKHAALATAIDAVHYARFRAKEAARLAQRAEYAQGA